MQMITKFDENGRHESDRGLVFRDIWDMNLSRYGMEASKKGDVFRRVPDDIAKGTNEGVAVLALNTSGMRVRLKTNSRRLALRFTRKSAHLIYHNMCFIGSGSFDIMTFENGQWRLRDVLYNVEDAPVCLGVYDFGNADEKEILIHFPMYDNVDKLELGLEENASCLPGEPYRDIKPVLYYGSSITQGGCASRPGNTYQAKIARRLNLDFWNMGFSGSARGEFIMANYLAGYDTSLFVCDYDHNSPTVEHLREHHYAFYSLYREKRPYVPILFITKPDADAYPEAAAERRAVIYETYRRAKAEGDDRVYFLDGGQFFGKENREDCTVDTCHPNDLGFECMANLIGERIRTILGL